MSQIGRVRRLAAQNGTLNISNEVRKERPTKALVVDQRRPAALNNIVKIGVD